MRLLFWRYICFFNGGKKQQWVLSLLSGSLFFSWCVPVVANQLEVNHYTFSKVGHSQWPVLMRSNFQIEKTKLLEQFPSMSSSLYQLNEERGVLWVVDTPYDESSGLSCWPQALEIPSNEVSWPLFWFFPEGSKRLPLIAQKSMFVSPRDYERMQLVFNIAGNEVTQHANTPMPTELAGCHDDFNVQWLMVLPAKNDLMAHGNQAGLTISNGHSFGAADEEPKKKPYGRPRGLGGDFEISVMNSGLYFELDPMANGANSIIADDHVVLQIIYDDGTEEYQHLSAQQWLSLWKRMTGGFLEISDLIPSSATLRTWRDDWLFQSYMESVAGIISYGGGQGGSTKHSGSASGSGPASTSTSGLPTLLPDRVNSAWSGSSGGGGGQPDTSQKCPECGRYVEPSKMKEHMKLRHSASTFETFEIGARFSGTKREGSNERGVEGDVKKPKLSRKEKAQRSRQELQKMHITKLPVVESNSGIQFEDQESLHSEKYHLKKMVGTQELSISNEYKELAKRDVFNHPKTKSDAVSANSVNALKLGGKRLNDDPVIESAPQKIAKIEPSTITANSATKSPGCVLKKSELPRFGKKFFLSDIENIFSANVVLSNIPFFELPISGMDGRIFNKIETCCLSGEDSIISKMNSLDESELMLNILVKDFNMRLYFQLALHSNEGDEKNKKKVKDDIQSVFYNPEFFSISFWLVFDEFGELEVIEPARGVNELLRRKGICRLVSLNALKKVYEHLGSKNSQLDSSLAGRVGTVKFYYPLNKYCVRSSGESLRDFDPRSGFPDCSDIIEQSEPLSDFDILDGSARCPHKKINLEKLLLQYELRKHLQERFTGST